MNQNKLLLLSLVNDLQRISNSIANHSLIVADRFSQESQHWIKSAQTRNLEKYIKDILIKLKNKTLKSQNNLTKAEECLTYSVIIQNYALTL
jgi:uncharacterized membrane protein